MSKHRLQYDRNQIAFVTTNESEHEIITSLNLQLQETRSLLDLKLRSGRYSHGFAIELCLNTASRRISSFAIFDEIGKLERADSRPSLTKKAKPLRGALKGLWNKHYFDASFMAKNILDEFEFMERNGGFEEIFEPHIGKYTEEWIGQVTAELVDGSLRKRYSRQKLTGEFIVFEKRENESNCYWTLGHHGEWEEIRARIEAYRIFETSKAG